MYPIRIFVPCVIAGLASYSFLQSRHISFRVSVRKSLLHTLEHQHMKEREPFVKNTRLALTSALPRHLHNNVCVLNDIELGTLVLILTCFTPPLQSIPLAIIRQHVMMLLQEIKPNEELLEILEWISHQYGLC